MSYWSLKKRHGKYDSSPTNKRKKPASRKCVWQIYVTVNYIYCKFMFSDITLFSMSRQRDLKCMVLLLFSGGLQYLVHICL